MENKELIIEEQGEEILEINAEELETELDFQKELNRMNREIVYDDDSLAQMINSESFQEGCEDAMYFCGFYTSLINAGLSNTQAFEMTLNMQTCNHNQILQRIISENQLEVSKTQQFQMQNQQL